jgi:hypothetical protein
VRSTTQRMDSEARRRNASALSVRFSKSLASRRQRLHDEAFGLVQSLDDLYREMWQVPCHSDPPDAAKALQSLIDFPDRL